MKKHPPKPPRRSRHAAMRDVGSDDSRQRAQTGRGLKPDRPRSPPRGPRHKSDNRARRRQSEAVSVAHASTSAPRPQPSSHHRHHSRDRDRDRSPEDPRRPADKEDLIPRFRAGRERAPESEDRSRRRSRSSEHGRRTSPSSATKRPRSRSQSPSSSHRKRSKRDHSPSRRGRDRSPDPGSRKHRHHSSRDRRRASPQRHGHSHRSPSRPQDPHSRSKRRSLSRSPSGSRAGSRSVARDSRQPRSDRPSYQSRSRSPIPAGRISLSRRLSDASRTSHPRSGPSTTAGEPSLDELDRRASHRHQPPQSPRHYRDRRHRDDSPERYYSSRSDIDDDMASRGSYRGGYHPAYSHNAPFGNDPHGYSQSPQPGGSYHNSPPDSPYGGGRGAWAGQQYSPQQ